MYSSLIAVILFLDLSPSLHLECICHYLYHARKKYLSFAARIDPWMFPDFEGNFQISSKQSSRQWNFKSNHAKNCFPHPRITVQTGELQLTSDVMRSVLGVLSRFWLKTGVVRSGNLRYLPSTLRLTTGQLVFHLPLLKNTSIKNLEWYTTCKYTK